MEILQAHDQDFKDMILAVEYPYRIGFLANAFNEELQGIRTACSSYNDALQKFSKIFPSLADRCLEELKKLFLLNEGAVERELKKKFLQEHNELPGHKGTHSSLNIDAVLDQVDLNEDAEKILDDLEADVLRLRKNLTGEFRNVPFDRFYDPKSKSFAVTPEFTEDLEGAHEVMAYSVEELKKFIFSLRLADLLNKVQSSQDQPWYLVESNSIGITKLEKFIKAEARSNDGRQTYLFEPRVNEKKFREIEIIK